MLLRDSSWDILVTESVYREALLLRLLSRRRPIVLLVGIEPIYMRVVAKKRAAGLRRAAFLNALLRWDGFITQSLAMEWQLQLLAGKDVPTTRWFPPVRAPEEMLGVRSSQEGVVVALMHGDGERRTDWRIIYKGLDRVADVSSRLPDPVQVFGSWDAETVERFSHALAFRGPASRAAAFQNALCVLHLARRESFGVVVVEAMLAGIPVIVSGAGSEWLVAAVEPRLVVQDASQALSCIGWLRGLTPAEYSSLGDRLRNQAQEYCEYASSPEASARVADFLQRTSRRHGE